MRRRQGSAGFPAIAFVDALVCAIGIVLILVAFSTPEARDPGTENKADVIVRCVAPGDKASVMVPGKPVESRPVPLRTVLSALPVGLAEERLSLKVRVEATPDLVRCALIVAQLAEDANAGYDANRPDALGTVLLVDIAYLSGEGASETPRFR